MRYMEPTDEQRQSWNEWLAGRPEAIKAMARRFEPWSLYLVKSTGQRVFPVAYSEDGTLTVAVLARFNPDVIFERRVFGIFPDDLEPILELVN